MTVTIAREGDAMAVTDAGVFHHTCFVVRDVEKAARALASSLSIGPWGVWTIQPDVSTVRGRAETVSFRLAIAPVGAVNLELIEPVSGASAYAEHLASKGEGFHHTCLAYPTLEAMREARDELQRQGRALVQSGVVEGVAEFYYFEIAETGSVLELLFLTELPPPEMTIG